MIRARVDADRSCAAWARVRRPLGRSVDWITVLDCCSISALHHDVPYACEILIRAVLRIRLCMTQRSPGPGGGMLDETRGGSPLTPPPRGTPAADPDPSAAGRAPPGTARSRAGLSRFAEPTGEASSTLVSSTGSGSELRRLVRGNRAFTALAASRLVSFVGDSLSLVALMLHVAQTGGQAIAVAALLVVGDVVPGLLGPLAGALADRFDRRRLMVVCELVQGAALVALAVALPPLPVLLALVGVRALAGQVFAPASRAALPALVADRDLPVANTAIGFGANGAEAAGPLLAAVLLPVLGVSGVLLVDAASFAVSAALLARLPALPPSRAEGAPTSLVRDARTGLAYLRGAAAVRIVVVGFCAIVAANGIDDVALVVLATDDLRTGPSAVVLLLAAVGIGLLVGYLLLTRTAARVPAAVLLVVGF